MIRFKFKLKKRERLYYRTTSLNSDPSIDQCALGVHKKLLSKLFTFDFNGTFLNRKCPGFGYQIKI